VGQEHTVRFGECWSFVSTRKSDGERAVGGGKIDAEPKECPELAAPHA